MQIILHDNSGSQPGCTPILVNRNHYSLFPHVCCHGDEFTIGPRTFVFKTLKDRGRTTNEPEKANSAEDKSQKRGHIDWQRLKRDIKISMIKEILDEHGRCTAEQLAERLKEKYPLKVHCATYVLLSLSR